MLDYMGMGKFVQTLNCHSQNCTRWANFWVGIDTIIVNILVLRQFFLTNFGLAKAAGWGMYLRCFCYSAGFTACHIIIWACQW